MRKICVIFYLILISFTVYASDTKEVTENDTSEVISLNNAGYANRLNNARQTIADADNALRLALKIGYARGVAESYRIKGIGEYYLNRPDSAINRYYESLNQYEKIGDQTGMANVYNNIGNLYQMIDYEKALDNFTKAFVIAEKFKDNTLIAKLYLNIGNIYNRQNRYNMALESYYKSHELFTKLNNPEFLVQCLENLGVIYFHLHNYPKATQLLTEANEKAKKMDLNASVAAINLTLTDLYVAQGDFARAQFYMDEGKNYATMLNNTKDIYDYKHTAYELELKRKNYGQALKYLINIYQEDSTNYKTNVSTKLNLQQKEQARIVEKITDQKNAENSRIRFWWITGMAGLLIVVVILLYASVKRKASTNLQLQELNSEISRQKDNLDRINHHLEEIIDERTKDLQVKNKKLSEYSSYLSHQIRGPIATLKGLMNLEKEGLVDQQECINMMDKCVSEIDEKIIEMSDMLHDPGKTGF